MKSNYEVRKISVGIEYGGVAQLGECLNGIQDVSGSIPLISHQSKDFCGQ